MKNEETCLVGVQKFPVILEWLKNYWLNPEWRREGSSILRIHKCYALTYEM